MAEDLKITEDIPSDAQVARGKYLLGTGMGVAVSLPLAYGAIGYLTGDWDLTDGIQNFNGENDAGNLTQVEKNEEDVASVDENTADIREDISELKDDIKEVLETKTIPESVVVVANCPADQVVEEVKEKVCIGPKEELVATADSSCDGIISLTREALWDNADFVTQEMVEGIDNPLVKAVYQALLDGDRSALTTALTNLYAENGAFDPENASGVLDGLKDSIIIYEGDRIVIDENGWTLVRAGGDVVSLVNCNGELLEVNEAMSDTEKCGDAAPQRVRGNAPPIIRVEELPLDPISEPDCVIEPVRIGRDDFNNYTGQILTINVYDDLDNDSVPSDGDTVRYSNVDARTYFDKNPEDIPDGVRKMKDGYYYNVAQYEAYLAAREEAMARRRS